MVRVMAKPLMVPVPKIISTTPAMMVVTLESRMAREGALKAALHRSTDGLARLELFLHAFKDDDIGVHSHADGQHNTGNTGQRQLHAGNDSQQEQVDQDVDQQRQQDATAPGRRYMMIIKRMTSNTPMMAAVMEVLSASSPSVAEIVRTSSCSMFSGSAPD